MRILNIWYCCFVHSQGLMAGTTIMAIEMLSHIHSWRARGALLVGSGHCSTFVYSVELKSGQLDLSVSMLLLLGSGPILLLLLLLFATFSINIDVIHALDSYYGLNGVPNKAEALTISPELTNVTSHAKSYWIICIN